MTGIPLVDGFLGAFGAVCVALGLLAGGYKAFTDARGQKIAKATSLAERVAKLEASDETKSEQIFNLRNQVYRMAGALTREVSSIIRWFDTGQQPPPPEREVRVLKELIEEIRRDQNADYNKTAS